MTLYYQDNHVTLYHGDCLTEHREWLDADVLVTDPPYGMSFTQGKGVNGGKGWTSRHTGTEIAGDTTTEARDSALEDWGEKPAIVFGTWKQPRPGNVRTTLIWDKVVSTGMGALDIPWRPSHEEIYVLGSGFVGKRGHGVLRHSLPTISDERKWHPTPKPLSLMVDLVAKCPPGAIADPFAGSGATIVAARDLGRHVIGVELEEKYCEIIAKRLDQQVIDFEALT